MTDYEEEFNRAFGLLGSNNFAGALEGFEKARQIDPEQSTSYYFIGLACVHLAQCERGVEFFRKHLLLRPTNGATAMSLFSALCKLQRFEEAFAEAIGFRDRYRRVGDPEQLARINDKIQTTLWFGELESLRGQGYEAHAAYGNAFSEWWFDLLEQGPTFAPSANEPP